MDTFLAADPITPPIKRHGGKHYLAKRIISLMPPHTHYVEPFFGAGGVLLQKNPEGVSEVINDIDGELICFWRAASIGRAVREVQAAGRGHPVLAAVVRRRLGNRRTFDRGPDRAGGAVFHPGSPKPSGDWPQLRHAVASTHPAKHE
jgi:hypothetical protein